MTEHLVMLELEDRAPVPKAIAEEAAEEDGEENEKEVVPSSAPSLRHTSSYVNTKTFGVRDRNGEWVEVPTSQSWAAHPAKYLTRRDAEAVFATHPYAFQLVDGCDIWACLSDENEAFVTVKENPDVSAPEAILGTPGD